MRTWPRQLGLLTALCVALAAACSRDDPPKPVVAPLPLPAGVRWKPADPRTPRPTLEVVNDVVRLTVTVGVAVDALVVTGPGPEFAELASRTQLTAENGGWKHVFELRRAALPAAAKHLVIYSKSSQGSYGAGQALVL